MTQVRPMAFKAVAFNGTQGKEKPFLVAWTVSGVSLELL